jgi:putative endopeptidase
MLGKKFEDERFTMVAALTGQKAQRPRWKRCLRSTNGAIGELLAQPYIDKMFPGNSKTAAENMVKAISSAFKSGVSGLDWMSGTTKTKAEEKRAAMAYLIGYPDKWKTYDFEITGDSYAGNVLAANAWELKRQLGKVGKPYDRGEWFMVPQTVNAYYNPLANQMVFPAGILQKPFFDENASAAVNLGSMGMIVGHELTHGFDDMGSQFAANGKMANWWQKEDLDKFKAKGECVIAQYASYEPLPGQKINGKLTLGENIADIGGVKFAYKAYKDLRSGEQPVVADGYTEDQQFFLAVGQAWCSKYREETLRQRLITDPHSPAKYRVNGALSNQPEFADAFQCKEGTAMNPKNSCEVW